MTDTYCIHNGEPTTNRPYSNVTGRHIPTHPIRPSPPANTLTFNKRRKFFDQTSQRLKASGLPGADTATTYLWNKYIKNLSAETIKNAGGILLSFLRFLHDNDTSIFTLTRHDINAFVEYDQDRGLQATSVIGHLRVIYAFLVYLVKHEVVPDTIMQRKIRIKEPEPLPKAIPAEDIQLLLDAIDSVRNRALLLLLLRTGLRIGELLAVTLSDIILRDRKILIYLGEKNFQGRAVYFNEDAELALRQWLRIRDTEKRFLFYGTKREQLSYSAAWSVMRNTLERAELSHKNYSLHSLRHTFATDMLNGGMRLEVLQKILGHRSIELTMRYARLSDQTLENDYFRAMEIIERGGRHHEPYRVSNALQKVFEEKKLLDPHNKKLSE